MASYVIFLICWAGIGVAIAAVLARRGHNFWILAAMGLAYGPTLALVPLLAGAAISGRTVTAERGPDDRTDGWLTVLIGLDGTGASIASVRKVLRTIEPAVRRIHLASVIDHEIAANPDNFELDDVRWDYLHDAALGLGWPGADRSLLSGAPDDALVRKAGEIGADLILVGHRTRPMGRLVQGSTVVGLAKTAEIPVLVGPHE